MSINVQLEKFEGPLGLLLYLIRKEEMDIFDINIHHITRQYLEYVKAMKKLDLEGAGDFVGMASTLIHIKSRMLLPQYNDDGEVIEEQDPRKDLVQKLLEYQTFQEASQKLNQRPLLGRDVFVRGFRTQVEIEDDSIEVEENPLYALIKSYRFAIKNMKKSIHKVMGALQSIAERVLEIKDKIPLGGQVSFYQLIDVSDSQPILRRNQVLVTFLSLLEICKLGFVALFQSEPLAEIYIEGKRQIDGNAIDRVEDFVVENKAELISNMIESSTPMESLVEVDLNEDIPDDQIEMVADTVTFDSDGDGDEEGYRLEEESATDEEIEAEEQRIANLDREVPDITGESNG